MISVIEDRAIMLLHKLFNAFQSQWGLYKQVSIADAVQHVFIPKGIEKGSMQHLVWLFFATMTDRRQVSWEVYKAHVFLHEQFPHFYTPAINTVRLEELTDTLIKVKIGVPRQSAAYWFRCAATLWGVWEGNPKRLYEGGSIASALAWKEGYKKQFKTDPLPGFGPKIMSLYALYLAELQEVKLADAFPVDVHIQRWFISTGCIAGLSEEVRNEEMEVVIRPFITNFCQTHGIPWTDLSHAIWFLGNKVCTGCSGKNTARLLCPTYYDCGGPINSNGYFARGRWFIQEQRLRRGGDTTFVLPADLPLFRCL